MWETYALLVVIGVAIMPLPWASYLVLITMPCPGQCRGRPKEVLLVPHTQQQLHHMHQHQEQHQQRPGSARSKAGYQRSYSNSEVDTYPAADGTGNTAGWGMAASLTAGLMHNSAPYFAAMIASGQAAGSTGRGVDAASPNCTTYQATFNLQHDEPELYAQAAAAGQAHSVSIAQDARAVVLWGGGVPDVLQLEA